MITLKTFFEVLSMIKEIVLFVEKNKEEQWYKDCSKLFSDLRAAKSPEEKKNAALRLRDIIRDI